MDGMPQLRLSKKHLDCDVGDPRERLRLAAHQFWTAYFYVDTWPYTLCVRAEKVVRRIFRHGVIDEAVTGMSDASAAEISKDLILLCEEAEQVDQSS